MNAALRGAFEAELAAAQEVLERGHLEVAFHHLERAHVLSQRHTVAHVRVHLWMLRVGWRRRDAREVRRQLVRMLAAAVLSRIWVPLGNTGGANVSAVKPMPVPSDLARWLA